MAKINWTKEAEFWINEIYKYIAGDSLEKAFEVINSIYEKVQLLKEYPYLGHLYQEYPEKEIRILLYGHYRIAYIIKENELIDILGVFHGALDIDRYLV